MGILDLRLGVLGGFDHFCEGIAILGNCLIRVTVCGLMRFCTSRCMNFAFPKSGSRSEVWKCLF